MKGLAPTLFGLSLGAIALWVFFGWLFTLFRTERDDGAREAKAHRAAVEAYALAEVTAELRARLSVASAQLEQARRDPLLDDGDLFLAVGDQQVVPPLPGAEPAAGPPAPGSPEARRFELVTEIASAVTANDRPAIERATRALLAERSRYVVPIDVDVHAVLAAIDVLERAGPAPELVRMLLRDGVSVDGKSVPQGLEGLQRALLRRKSRLSRERLRALCAVVAEHSRHHHLPAADFKARCQDRQRPRPKVWQLLAGESLWRAEQDAVADTPVWFVRAQENQAEGVAVDVKALVGELTGRLRARGLLADEDRLGFDVPAGTVALPRVAVRLFAPGWDASARTREERFVVKSVLLGVSAALTLGLAALAVLAQRRKLRFVELKSDFVATVSHELRTPLASMRVMAETLEHRLAGHPGAKDYPARIVREVDGLSTLVENILSFNRLDKGRWQRRDSEVPLSALEAPLREEAERYAGAKVALTFTGFEGVTLRADRALLQLLLTNLLRNACTYNARDPVTVAFAWDAGTLRVTDNGVGIPEGEQANVFVEFHRLPGDRGRGGAGSGLGLALARRIMALHHGSIAVERSNADGTTFVLKFPRS